MTPAEQMLLDLIAPRDKRGLRCLSSEKAFSFVLPSYEGWTELRQSELVTVTKADTCMVRHPETKEFLRTEERLGFELTPKGRKWAWGLVLHENVALLSQGGRAKEMADSIWAKVAEKQIVDGQKPENIKLEEEEDAQEEPAEGLPAEHHRAQRDQPG